MTAKTTQHGGPRKGAGRKPTGVSTSTISFRLPTSEKSGWVKQAQAKKMKLSEWVRARCSGHHV